MKKHLAVGKKFRFYHVRLLQKEEIRNCGGSVSISTFPRFHSRKKRRTRDTVPFFFLSVNNLTELTRN